MRKSSSCGGGASSLGATDGLSSKSRTGPTGGGVAGDGVCRRGGSRFVRVHHPGGGRTAIEASARLGRAVRRNRDVPDLAGRATRHEDRQALDSLLARRERQ